VHRRPNSVWPQKRRAEPRFDLPPPNPCLALFPQLDILGILIAYLVRGVSSSPRAGVYLYFKDHPA
jgi:hypothetical protein